MVTTLNLTSLQRALFSLLCKTAGSRINQRALAARLKVTPAAVSKALPGLEERGLILVKKQGAMNLKEVELNRDDHHVVQLKRIENVREIYGSGLLDALAERYAGSTIVLIGSYARGEDTVRSDIDLVIIGSKEKAVDLQVFEKMLERPVRITYVRSLSSLSPEFRESVINGIVLEGGLRL